MKTMTNIPDEKFMPHPGLVVDLVRRWQMYSDKTAMQIADAGQVKIFTYNDLLQLSAKLAYKISNSERKITKIAILSESRPEWVLSLFASFIAQATLIALDPSLSDNELAKQIAANDCDLLIISRKHQSRCQALGFVDAVWTLETTVEHLRLERDFIKIDWTQLNFQQVLIIVQGSGTTGGSKSVMISAANLLYELSVIKGRIGISDQDRILSILPINHLFELTAGTLSPLYCGATVIFANTLMPHEIVQLLAQENITILVGVPLFFKAMKRSIELNLQNNSWINRQLFKAIMFIAEILPQNILRVLLPIHKRLGAHLRFFISGGAALPFSVESFFRRCGIKIYQGYGLTEASPVISANGEKLYQPGSCGQALPGTEIKIMDQDAQGIGEVWVRGPQVMLGYWNDAAATEQVLTPDAWLKTGDLGYLDKRGFLFLTGRSRNLVVLGGGKKVFPEEIEALLNELHIVKELCILGVKHDEWEEVTLVCVPQDDLWVNDLEAVRSQVALAVQRLLANTADYKLPKRILLSRMALPKTSTHKVKIANLRERIQLDELL